MAAVSGLVVDGTHLVHRSRRAEDAKGHVSEWLHLLRHTAGAQRTVAVFDAKRGGAKMRRMRHPTYKGKGKRTSHAFAKAWDAARKAAIEMPSSSVMVAEQKWEADDLIANLCRNFQRGQEEWHGAQLLYVASADSDMQQLLRPEVAWIQMQSRPTADAPRCVKIVTWEDFSRQFGFQPELYPDYLALKGKPEVGVSGLGVGSKGAKKLIRAFGGIETILDAARRGELKGWGSHVQNAFAKDGAQEQARYNLALFLAGKELETEFRNVENM